MEGGIISASDKWILDIWYVHNASFVLDLKIVIRTVQMVLFGDPINAEACVSGPKRLGSDCEDAATDENDPAE